MFYCFKHNDTEYVVYDSDDKRIESVTIFDIVYYMVMCTKGYFNLYSSSEDKFMKVTDYRFCIKYLKNGYKDYSFNVSYGQKDLNACGIYLINAIACGVAYVDVLSVAHTYQDSEQIHTYQDSEQAYYSMKKLGILDLGVCTYNYYGILKLRDKYYSIDEVVVDNDIIQISLYDKDTIQLSFVPMSSNNMIILINIKKSSVEVKTYTSVSYLIDNKLRPIPSNEVNGIVASRKRKWLMS